MTKMKVRIALLASAGIAGMFMAAAPALADPPGAPWENYGTYATQRLCSRYAVELMYSGEYQQTACYQVGAGYDLYGLPW